MLKTAVNAGYNLQRPSYQPLKPDETPVKRAIPAIGGDGGIAAAKARSEEAKKIGEPCKTCKYRSYSDSSSDAGVSFKGGASVSPYAAAGQVAAHERQHAAHVSREGAAAGVNMQATVRIKTAICPECSRVYIAGGVTQARVGPQKPEPYSDFCPPGLVLDEAI